uniref:Uncharacterized protein n=1 Tax=Anguilla anguilla TaxID=7936 RepID=A0A0E9PWV3_ANGAN
MFKALCSARRQTSLN